MKKLPLGPPQVVQLSPAKIGRSSAARKPETLDQLIHSSLKLRKLEETIGRAAIGELFKLEGEPKSLFVLHRFVQYYDDFKGSADFFLYALACGRYLSKQEPEGKFAEVFPVRIDSQEARRERSRYFYATRRIGHYFQALHLTAAQAKIFIEEASPFVFPLFIGRPFSESLMLRENFIIEVASKSGFDRFIGALRRAVKEKPSDLQAEIIRQLEAPRS